MLRNRKLKRGLTLLEVVIGTALTLLLFFGALNLYVAAAQLSIHTTASCYAVTDAVNAAQRTIRDTEEARWLALPGQNGWTSPGNAAVSAFQANDNGTMINTGVELVFPATTNVTVSSRTGGSLTVTPAPYDRSADAAGQTQLWIYRADGGGAPNASAGAYLWMSGTEHGQAVSRSLLSSLSSTTVNAVQFSRPATAAPASQALPYLLQISLVSAYYSPLRQVQTSEIDSTSQETYVVGKCVLLRDHEMNFDHEPNSNSTYAAANSPTWRSD